MAEQSDQPIEITTSYRSMHYWYRVTSSFSNFCIENDFAKKIHFNAKVINNFSGANVKNCTLKEYSFPFLETLTDYLNLLKSNEKLQF